MRYSYFTEQDDQLILENYQSMTLLTLSKLVNHPEGSICRRMRILGLTKKPRSFTLSDEERFQTKYIPEPNTGCWLWMADVDQKGYGRFSLNGGKRVKAHRFSWKVHNGEIPEELDGQDYRGPCILHSCDNPTCVNPHHLFVGTQFDNIKDMIQKGRHWRVSKRQKLLSI